MGYYDHLPPGKVQVLLARPVQTEEGNRGFAAVLVEQGGRINGVPDWIQSIEGITPSGEKILVPVGTIFKVAT